MRYFRDADGWYVLLWDELYNGQHCYDRLLLKSPVLYWSVSLSGEDCPIPYGNPEKPKWGELAQCVTTGATSLVPLAFDAILAPDGSVFGPEERYPSIERWLRAEGHPPEKIQVDVVSHPGLAGPGSGYSGERPLEPNPLFL